MAHHAVRLAGAVLLFAALVACRTLQQVPPLGAPVLIPAPAQLDMRPGAFAVARAAPLVIRCDGEAAAAVAARFAEWLHAAPGIDAGCNQAVDTRFAILFELVPGFAAGGDHADEAYDLRVAPDGIVLSARDAHGLFNGATTLWQLFAAAGPPAASVRIPALHIVDYPRFAWRGLLLDSARHFQPPDAVEHLIDAMALHKLDVLHWHLTDDQGWRIEIRRYPRLTAVGAWRAPQPDEAGLADPATGRYGGYYTQAQIRRIVAYAAARHVMIVPEIDMPGHAQAAIAAYPQLGVDDSAPPVSSDWGIHTYLYNVDESTFTFIDNVFAEVAELFPAPYIHVGGDEAAKDRWQASPRVHERMARLGIRDETALQGYFTARLAAMLRARGRRLIGWDDILDGGLPEGATVMSWRGREGAIAAARRGDDVVMTPDPLMYFDHLQSRAPDEPPGRIKPLTLADVYAFEALPRELDTAQAAHVIGGQGNLWSEYLTTPQRVEHAAFPRAAALAEALWSQPERRSWPAFVARLPVLFERYRALGTGFADSAFEPQFAFAPAPGARIAVTLRKQEPFGTIRYTLDGSAPRSDSAQYEKPVAVGIPATVRAATFAGTALLAEPRTRSLDASTLRRRPSDALTLCSDSLALRLEGAPIAGQAAPLYNVDLMDPCWIYPQVDFDAARRIDVRIGALPYFFQLWHEAAKVAVHAPAGAGAELQLRLDGCAGEPFATVALDDSRQSRTLEVALPAGLHGRHDVCALFGTRTRDPLRLIEWVEPIVR